MIPETAKGTSWRKAKRSNDGGGQCVEVGLGVGMRDSKAPATEVPLCPAAWSAFLQAVKIGQLG
ncbi:protein of unknown function [Lentzea albidocapillata subsp. violacea]|uniref:DUF397 domain-containing protein n=1 Tax=Lentzea albidocapillata subsp. violacea TaxID=128104 RepID=A0A1G9AQ66_9PSEU|nr:DUF397 domain-containing protein [Lentzea albidocapillata]SDK29519.1 protein of unknown function [Lentzea albidocapillata subsp. violacea]